MTQERIGRIQPQEAPSMSATNKMLATLMLAMAVTFVSVDKVEAGLKEAQARQAQETAQSETENKLVHEGSAITKRVGEIYAALKSMDQKSNEARKLLDELVELKAKLIANGEARAKVDPKFSEAKDYKAYTIVPNGIDEVLAMLDYEPKGPIVLSENIVNKNGK